MWKDPEFEREQGKVVNGKIWGRSGEWRKFESGEMM